MNNNYMFKEDDVVLKMSKKMFARFETYLERMSLDLNTNIYIFDIDTDDLIIIEGGRL